MRINCVAKPNGICLLFLVITSSFSCDILKVTYWKINTFYSSSFVYDSNTWPLQLQTLSCAITRIFPLQEIIGSGTPMLGNIKNATTNLTRASNAFARISVTACVSELESFQRRVHAITGSDLRGQSFATRVQAERKMTATVSLFYLTETVTSRQFKRLQGHVSLPQGGRAGRAATWLTPRRVIGQNFLQLQGKKN